MTYLGIDVLEVWNNVRDGISESFARSGELIDNQTGPRVWDDHAAAATPVRSFTWTCATRAECVGLRDFLKARRGRVVPFWVPTYCWDMELAIDYPQDVNQLTIKNAGYGLYLGGSLSRRFIAVFASGRPAEYREIVNVTSSPTTEVIEINGDALSGLMAATTRICFLVLCRLADDATSIEWFGRTVCEAQIQFQELLREYPAFAGQGAGALTPVSIDPQHYIG
jgi:hypothetical protein